MNELMEWIAALDPAMAFLFALPFLVAAAGLFGHLVRSALSHKRADTPSVRAPSAVQPRHNHHAWG
jgi:hypothetical protein